MLVLAGNRLRWVDFHTEDTASAGARHDLSLRVVAISSPLSRARGLDVISAVRQTKNFVERSVTIARQDRIVLHRWKKHTRGLALTSVLLAKNNKKPLGGPLTAVVEDWDALVARGKEHAEETRERAEKFQSKKTAPAPAPAAGNGKRKRATADVQVVATDRFGRSSIVGEGVLYSSQSLRLHGGDKP